MDHSLLIVGAGPAGLMAALCAARARPGSVVVVDHMPKAGAKLAAAGGGRGNLSHSASEVEFADAFGRHGRFAVPAFRSLSPDLLREELAHIGVPTVVDPDGRVYPRNQNAGSVRDSLFLACERAGIRFLFNRRALSIRPPASPNAPWLVDDLSARCVVLAAGGQSAPRFGSDGSGFALASALGYSIVPPVPALVSLRTEESWPASLSGVSLPAATLTLKSPKRPPVVAGGGLLFTHRGISGPAVLNLSGAVARRLHDSSPVAVHLSFVPDVPRFDQLRRAQGARPVLGWLAERMPRSLAATLLDLSAVPASTPFAKLAAAQEQALLNHLMACPLSVRSTGGFDESMATSGGISLKQVDPLTLQGKLTPRLFFAGEILDLDGPTGGWNLHWAFASGRLAGLSAALA